MTHETLERLLQVMRRSRSIEELHLENLGLRADFAHKLSLAILANPDSPLHTLDLSHNLIEDKGWFKQKKIRRIKQSNVRWSYWPQHVLVSSNNNDVVAL